LSRIQQELPGIETIGAINDPQAIVKALTRIREVFLFSVSLAAKYGALQQQFDELKQQQAQQQQLGGGGGAAEGATVAALQGEIEAIKQQHKKEMENLTKGYEEKIAAALKAVAKQKDVEVLQGQVAVQGKAVVEVRKTGDATARKVQQVAQQQGKHASQLQERNVVIRGIPVERELVDDRYHVYEFFSKGLGCGSNLMEAAAEMEKQKMGVEGVKILGSPSGDKGTTVNAVVTMRSVPCKMKLFRLWGGQLAGGLADKAYLKVRMDDDLTKENREKQQVMLVKRREMLKKKEAEAVVVRNHNMEPVMVAKIGGVWRVGTAEVKGRWEAGKALGYKWDFSREAKGAERPVSRDRRLEAQGGAVQV
jgi:hypothetical protein